MKVFRTALLVTSLVLGLCFQEALAQNSTLRISGVSGDGETDIALTLKGIDVNGDTTHQTVRAHLLVKQKKVTKLNYINSEASVLVVGGRALVIDLQGWQLPDSTGNSEANQGLSLQTGGLATFQVFFNRDFDLTEPVPVDDALVLTAKLSKAGSVDCLLWDIASGQIHPDDLI